MGMTPDADIERRRFRAAQHVRASMSDDGLVLLDLDGGFVLASNIAGARIWQLVEQRHTAAEIARRLASEFEIPIERARHDVVAFVRALLDRALLLSETTC
jgi:coenzyme PQQ synthesis protein D (PqqD)